MSGELNFLLYARIIWTKRKYIFIVCVLFALIGVFFAISSPNVYKASALFLPQSSDDKSGLSGLNGLASLAGVNVNSLVGDSKGIPPVLYPEIVKSSSFKSELLEKVITINEEKYTIKDYLETEKAGFSLGIIKKYTIGLPSLISSLFKVDSNEAIKSKGVASAVRKLSQDEFELYERVDDLLGISVSDKTGFIQLSFLAQDPVIAASIAQVVMDLLKEYILQYKIQNTKALFEFTKEQYELKRIDFINKQDRLADFKDKNMQISSNRSQNQLMRLEADYNLALNVFNELALQKEKINLQLEKETPLFAVIQPVIVPNLRTAPKRSVIVISYGLFGFVFSAMFFLLRRPTSLLINSIAQPLNGENKNNI